MTDIDRPEPSSESLSEEVEYKEENYHSNHHRYYERKNKNIIGSTENKDMKSVNKERLKSKETETSRHKRSTDADTKQCRRLDSGAAFSWHSGDESDSTSKSKNSGNNSHKHEDAKNLSYSSVSSKGMHNSVNNSSHTVSSHRQASEFSTSDNDTHQHSIDKLTNTESKKKETTHNTKKKKKTKKTMKRKAGSKNTNKDKHQDETNVIAANNAKGKENNRLSETERLRLRYMQSLKHTQNMMEEGQQQRMNNVQDNELRREYSDKTAFLCASDAAVHVQTERKWFDMPYSEYMQEMLSSSTEVEQIKAKHINNKKNNENNVVTCKDKMWSETKRPENQSDRNNVHYNVCGSKNINNLNVAEVRISEHGLSVGLPFQYETNYYNYMAHKNCNVSTSKYKSNSVHSSSNHDDMHCEYTYNGNCSRAHTLLIDGCLTNTHYPCLVREFAITHDMLQAALQRITPLLTQAINDVLCFNIHVDCNTLLYTKRNSTDKKSVLDVDDNFLEILFRNMREYLPIVEYHKVMKQTKTTRQTNSKTKSKSKNNDDKHQHEVIKQYKIFDNNNDDDIDENTNDVVIESKNDHTQAKFHEPYEKEMLEELTLESENDQCELNESRVGQELAYDTLHSESSLSAPLSLETTQLMPITTHVYFDNINNNNNNNNINKSKTSNNWHERSSSSAAQWWNNLYEHANDKETAVTAPSTEQLEQQSHRENEIFLHEHGREYCSDTPESEEQHECSRKQKTEQDLENGWAEGKMKHAMHVRWQSNGSLYQRKSLHNNDNNNTEIMQMPILALHVMRAPEEQIVGDERTEKVENTKDEQNVNIVKNNAVKNDSTSKRSKSKNVNSTLYKHKNAITTRYETITRVLAKNDGSKNRTTKESFSDNNNAICDDNNNNNNNFCIIIALALPLIWQGSVSELMHCVHECHVDYWTRENILRRWVKTLLPQLVKRHECKWFHGNLSTENWFDAANITCAMYDILSQLNKKSETAEELRKDNTTEKQEMYESENEHENNNISKLNKSNTKLDNQEFTSHYEREGKEHKTQEQTEWDNTHHANSHFTSAFSSNANKMSKYCNNIASQNASMSASHIIHSPLEHIRRHFSLSFSHDEKQCDEIPLESSSSTSSSSSSEETAEEPLSHVKNHKEKHTNKLHAKKTPLHTTNNATIDVVIDGKEEELEQGVNEIPCQSGICIADDYYEIVELVIAMTLAERVLSHVLTKINIKEKFKLQSHQIKEKLAEQQLWMTDIANNNNNGNSTNNNSSCMENSPSVLQTIVNKFVKHKVLESSQKEIKTSGSRGLHMFTLLKSEDIPAPECIRPELADKHVTKLTNHFSSGITTSDNKYCKSEENQKKVKDNASPFRESKNNLLPYSLLSPSVDVWQFGVSLLKLASVSGDLPSWCYYEHKPILSLECLQAEYGELAQRNNWKNNDGKANVKGTWSSEFAAFVDRCLETDPLLRPSFAELLNDPWLEQSSLTNVDETKKEKELENTIIDNYRNEHERNKKNAKNESNIKNNKKTNIHTRDDIKSVKSKCHDASLTKLTEEKEYYKAWRHHNVKDSNISTKWNSCKMEDLYQNKENNALNLIRNSRDVNTYSKSIINNYNDDDDDNISRKIMTYIISRKTNKVSSLSSLPSLILPLCTKGGELVAFHYNIKQCCSAMVHGNRHALRPNYTRLRELYVALVGQDRVDVNLLMCNNSSFQLSRNFMQRQRSLVNSINYGSLTTAAVPASTFALSATTTTTNHAIPANNTDKNYTAKEKSMRKEQKQQLSGNNKRYNNSNDKHKYLFHDNDDNLLQKSTRHNMMILPNASECNVSNFTNSYCSNSYRPLQHSWSRSINKSFRTNELQPFHSSSSICVTSQLMLSILLDRYGVHVEREPSLSNCDQITQNAENKTNSRSTLITQDTNVNNNNSSIYKSASQSKSLENNLEQTKAFYDLNEVNVLISAEEEKNTELTSSTPTAAATTTAETNFANANSKQTKRKEQSESVHETLSESNERNSCKEKNLGQYKEEGEVKEEDSVQGLTNAHHSPFLSIMSATLFDCERALRGTLKSNSRKSADNDNNFYDDDYSDEEKEVVENDNTEEESEENEKVSRLRDGIFAIMQSFWALHEQAPIAADIWGVLLLHALSNNTATLELLQPLIDTLHLLPIQQNNEAYENMYNQNEKVNTISSASNSVSSSMENTPATALQKKQVSLIDNNNTRQSTILTDENAQTLHKNDSKNTSGSSCLIKSLENRNIHNSQFTSHTRNYKANNRGSNDNNKKKRVKTMVNLIDPSLFHCYQSCKWYNASSMLLDAADHSK